MTVKKSADPIIRFTAVLERSDNKLWGAHLRVPRTAADAFLNGKTRRVLCSLNNTPERQCALVPATKGTYVITVNRSLRDSLGISFGSRIAVSVRKDRSKYGLPVPEELLEVFRQDRESKTLFHQLTPGRRRTLLYIVNSSKNPEDRVFRAVIVTRHLKENNGQINYRTLYTLLKKPQATKSTHQ